MHVATSPPSASGPSSGFGSSSIPRTPSLLSLPPELRFTIFDAAISSALRSQLDRDDNLSIDLLAELDRRQQLVLRWDDRFARHPDGQRLPCMIRNLFLTCRLTYLEVSPLLDLSIYAIITSMRPQSQRVAEVMSTLEVNLNRRTQAFDLHGTGLTEADRMKICQALQNCCERKLARNTSVFNAQRLRRVRNVSLHLNTAGIPNADVMGQLVPLLQAPNSGRGRGRGTNMYDFALVIDEPGKLASSLINYPNCWSSRSWMFATHRAFLSFNGDALGLPTMPLVPSLVQRSIYIIHQELDKKREPTMDLSSERIQLVEKLYDAGRGSLRIGVGPLCAWNITSRSRLHAMYLKPRHGRNGMTGAHEGNEDRCKKEPIRWLKIDYVGYERYRWIDFICSETWESSRIG